MPSPSHSPYPGDIFIVTLAIFFAAGVIRFSRKWFRIRSENYVNKQNIDLKLRLFSAMTVIMISILIARKMHIIA